MTLVITSPTEVDDVRKALLTGFSSIFSPQKLYILSLSNISDQTPPGDENYAGWRYLAVLAPDVGLANQVYQHPGEPPAFGGISYGRKAANALQALQQLNTLPGIADGSYEQRMLSVPGLLTETFWLKAISPATDVVVVYDSNLPDLRLMYPYSMVDFLKILNPPAKARLEFAEYGTPKP